MLAKPLQLSHRLVLPTRNHDGNSVGLNPSPVFTHKNLQSLILIVSVLAVGKFLGCSQMERSRRDMTKFITYIKRL